MTSDLAEVSKFLSYVLRHQPESIGLNLDWQGWASVSELIERATAAGRPLTRDLVERVVRENTKQRFRISKDGERIRANQGHSLDVDLGLAPVVPPRRLFHGTATRFLESISREGLRRGDRHHVHLSPDKPTAKAVGSRHGSPVVLVVRAREMHDSGYLFYLSANGVWLTDSVPTGFIEFPGDVA